MRRVNAIALFIVFSVAPVLATTHTITNSGFSFNPSTLTIDAGDTVVFSIAGIHNAAEVSQTTWDAGGITSNGGFSVPFGGGSVVLSVVGTHYYVCQAHASIGMKGIITVNPAPPPTSTITIESLVDQDGSLATISDRNFKIWSLKLYQDSVGSGIVLGSGNTTSLTVPDLSAGTYVAFESDSVSWSHISVNVDAVSEGHISKNQWTITVGTGETHTIDFLNFAPHTIINLGTSFFPDTLFIDPGDTVRFVLESIHNAVEVSKATWLADGITSNGGFAVPFGGGTAIVSTLGLHYYVCQAHASMGMKGIIVAGPPLPPPPAFLTVQSIVDQDGSLGTTADRQFKNWGLEVYKYSLGSGNVVASASSASSLTTDSLAAGTCVAIESDSTSWSHLSLSVNGSSQGTTSAHFWSIAIGAGENDTIAFLNFSQHTTINTGTAFLPESLFIDPGDTVRFVLESDLSAREVSQASWLANDTTSNSGFDTPLGGGSVILTQAGVHYYVCPQHASSGMKGRILVTPPPPTVSIAAPLIAGWNMVSLPVTTSDPRPGSVFLNPISLAFGYAGKYTPVSALATGDGYWLKFNQSGTDTITGFQVLHDSVGVVKGWNMIGSISVPVATGSIVTQPAGIITSPFFAFNNTYYIIDTLHPGGGYWVKVSQDGTLVLDLTSTTMPPAAHPEYVRAQPNRITITDATGKSQTLYIVQGAGSSSGVQLAAELPPIPPAGGFDARFSTGTQIAYTGGLQHELPIDVQSAVYPVTLRWDLPALHEGLALRTGQGYNLIHGTGSQTIDQAGTRIAIVLAPSVSAPNSYALEQAYPNPFNPTTSIQYSLPVQSHVLIRSYNLLGQMLATFVNGIQEAGTKSVSWNAGNSVSGVYFIRMIAVATDHPSRSFEKVVKVVLQK